MNLDLADRTAVVAGSAQGIGRAIARAFAAEGASVALIDRDESVREDFDKQESEQQSAKSRADNREESDAERRCHT